MRRRGYGHALDFERPMGHLVRATRDRAGNVVADVTTLLREIDLLADTSARLLHSTFTWSQAARIRVISSSVNGALFAALLEPTGALISGLTGDSRIHLRLTQKRKNARSVVSRFPLARAPSFQLAQNRSMSAAVIWSSIT